MEGHKVLAWINPTDPSESMLYRQIDRAMWLTRLVGAVVIGFAGLISIPWIVRVVNWTRRNRGRNRYTDQRFSP